MVPLYWPMHRLPGGPWVCRQELGQSCLAEAVRAARELLLLDGSRQEVWVVGRNGRRYWSADGGYCPWPEEYDVMAAAPGEGDGGTVRAA
jgi:hypothetical protein